jgi:hypothetical protein
MPLLVYGVDMTLFFFCINENHVLDHFETQLKFDVAKIYFKFAYAMFNEFRSNIAKTLSSSKLELLIDIHNMSKLIKYLAY